MSRLSYLVPLALFVVLGCTAKTSDEARTPSDDSAAGAVASATDSASPGEIKISNAMSAAPLEIARNATIMDWPATEGGEMKELRAGTNGWVCYPSTPPTAGASGEDPMCLDKTFQEWAAALIAKKQPKLSGLGIGYMHQGDRGASNTDPYAKVPTADNQWVETGPHVMVVSPNPAALASIPSDPSGGGPFVMWKGTPYAHVMVPLGEGARAH